MLGRYPLDKFDQGEKYTLQISKLREEIKRLGNVKGVGGITISTNAAGIFIGCESGGSDDTSEFGVLQESLTKNGSATVRCIVWDSDGSYWKTGSEEKTIYGSPLQRYDTIQSGATICFAYFSKYEKNIITNTHCT